MATKTRSKTATRKPAASAAGRKTTAPQKRPDVAPKAKAPKKGPTPAEPTPPAKHIKTPEELRREFAVIGAGMVERYAGKKGESTERSE